VFGQVVELQVVDTDRYGRTVAKVYRDGLDINREMVREG
jgi:endonuclease YncB( thermonuclease family)